jgi:hypothetical protein
MSDEKRQLYTSWDRWEFKPPFCAKILTLWLMLLMHELKDQFNYS